MKIYAVIVTCNAMKWMEKSLSSLFCDNRHGIRPHVIVADNASTDGTLEYISRTFSEAEIIRTAESDVNPDVKHGFTAAAQAGIDRALASGAEAVLLMHHDVWLAPEALEALEACCTDDSLLVPAYLNGPGTDYETSFSSKTVRHSRKLRKALKENRADAGKIRVGNVPSGCWLIPADLIKETGPLNPFFDTASGTASEYLARLRYRSKGIFVVPEARVFHDRDSYGDRTLYDKNDIFRDLLLIGCDPVKCGIARGAARISLFFGLVRKTVHYRVNLFPTYFNDLRRIRALRPELRKLRRRYEDFSVSLHSDSI